MDLDEGEGHGLDIFTKRCGLEDEVLVPELAGGEQVAGAPNVTLRSDDIPAVSVRSW